MDVVGLFYFLCTPPQNLFPSWSKIHQTSFRKTIFLLSLGFFKKEFFSKCFCEIVDNFYLTREEKNRFPFLELWSRKILFRGSLRHNEEEGQRREKVQSRRSPRHCQMRRKGRWAQFLHCPYFFCGRRWLVAKFLKYCLDLAAACCPQAVFFLIDDDNMFFLLQSCTKVQISLKRNFKINLQWWWHQRILELRVCRSGTTKTHFSLGLQKKWKWAIIISFHSLPFFPRCHQVRKGLLLLCFFTVGGCMGEGSKNSYSLCVWEKDGRGGWDTKDVECRRRHCILWAKGREETAIKWKESSSSPPPVKCLLLVSFFFKSILRIRLRSRNKLALLFWIDLCYCYLYCLVVFVFLKRSKLFRAHLIDILVFILRHF